MLINITNLNKSIGLKRLYYDLNLIIGKQEKSALIGKNGSGKTTLFHIIHGDDKDYTGTINRMNDLKITLTRQEHLLGEINQNISPIEYILNNVPEYNQLSQIIKNKEKTETYDKEYLASIGRFTDLDYYTIEDEILNTLNSFQINEDKAVMPLISLSGGEKRFIELTRVMYSNADLALIDEPTNHMDTIGKDRFIRWLYNYKKALLIITHDRDVLHNVNKIMELKNYQLETYKGNYEDYLRQNTIQTLQEINSYETDKKRMKKVKKQMEAAKHTKESARSNAGVRSGKIMEIRFQREYEKIKNRLNKPDFWIDKKTLNQIPPKLKAAYHKYKTKTVTPQKVFDDSKIANKRLFTVENLTVGYKEPLFKPISFELFNQEIVRLIGRNGAGKTTFLKHIIKEIRQDKKTTKINKFKGILNIKNNIRLGIYEQEISKKYLNEELSDAIGLLLKENHKPVNKTTINAILNEYLFNLSLHSTTKLRDLSGGEKARFQFIKMLINKPNLLILDEPTNHLDLATIEELEKYLLDYKGAIIYVSHDSYFAKRMEGETIEIKKIENN